MTDLEALESALDVFEETLLGKDDYGKPYRDDKSRQRIIDLFKQQQTQAFDEGTREAHQWHHERRAEGKPPYETGEELEKP